MRDQADLIRRAAEIKQALLMALKSANAAALDGTSDGRDLDALAQAAEQTRNARDQIQMLHKRLQFHVELARVAQGMPDEDSSRGMIGLVRVGVDGGYDVTEVRRMIDHALGRA